MDTCHLFAAGYDIRTQKTYREVMKQFGDTVGIEQIYAFHLNDSKKGLGGRVVRHEHIGQGAIGLEGFRALLNERIDSRQIQIWMIPYSLLITHAQDTIVVM